MKRILLPKPGSRSSALLQALSAGPGTFYQIAERAGFDIEEPGIEHRLRMIFARGIQGHVRVSGILYELKDASRDAMLCTKPPLQGQVAAPHFRGVAGAMPVLVVRRSTTAMRGVA
ncbi:hypothetical protein BA896_001490 [Janthinobacterium lividum]|uniref:Uncharacterized protein n=1 Tax=Janthinobacterium lividum TaxID=29581 RepID=A0A1E8PNJ5_9BURK|nr:hypothetical protein BA896_001490 [Janthinobacterium lividum]